MQKPQPRQEAAYVLRLWCDGDGAWRYSLDSLRNRQRWVFSTLAELEAHLLERTAGVVLPKEKP